MIPYKRFFYVPLLMIAVLLVACGTASPATPDKTSTPVPTPTPAVRPTSSEPRTGQQIFAQHCASCHGVDGQGDGAVAIEAKLSPADFTNAELFADKTLQDTIQAIKTGNIEKMMPPWEAALKADEIERVAEYVRSLAIEQVNNE